MLTTDRQDVLDVYSDAARRRWVVPCICAENLTTIEAILAATKEYGDTIGVADLPITVAITNLYEHRSQSVNYTHTRRWDVGLRLFLADLGVLTGSDSPYRSLRVMVHLDHIQHDLDAPLLSWDLRQFSSIMFDASTLPLDKNIAATRAFVEAHRPEIVIEGACDEILESAHGANNDLTTADKAERYFKETGADFIVANLGTEHRASLAELQYRGDYARAIRERIGHRIVLHGTSSVPHGQIGRLYDDGICKVNIWTAMERDSTPDLLRALVENASLVAGPAVVKDLQQRGLLGPDATASKPQALDYYSTHYRQEIVFESMKRIVRQFLSLWYR